MIEKLLLFFLITFLLNQLPLNSNKKIFFNICFGVLLSLFLEKNIGERIEAIFLFLNYYFIVMNIYTTRYSSIRFMILDKIIRKEKIPSENWLFNDRAKRLKKTYTFMSKNLFQLIYLPIFFFKKLFRIQ